MTDKPVDIPEPLPDLLAVDRVRRSPVVRVALLSASLVCFLLGVILWLTPVLTGIPFYILGLVLLGMASRRAAFWINTQERRLPHRWRLLLRRARRRKSA